VFILCSSSSFSSLLSDLMSLCLMCTFFCPHGTGRAEASLFASGVTPLVEPSDLWRFVAVDGPALVAVPAGGGGRGLTVPLAAVVDARPASAALYWLSSHSAHWRR
jgi:hypothetical protein